MELEIYHAYIVSFPLKKKSQKCGVWRAFKLVNTSTSTKSDAPQPTAWGKKLLCSRFSKILLYVSLHMAVHLYPSSHSLLYNVKILYKKMISVSVSLSSVSCSSK